MRTAIFTFQDAENYGAALQAYALKTFVQKYSDVDIVNYYNEYFHRDTSRMTVKVILKKIMNFRTAYRKHRRFCEFQKNFLVDGQAYIYRDEVEALNSTYDIFISGSDQVWNFECSGNDKTYFLDFATDEKKYSYAASFGSAELIETDKIKQLLNDYKYISVRENSGKQLIKNILDRDVPVVLDPTFLLNKEEWGNFFSLKFSENYILVYEVLIGDKLFEQAKAFAKKKNLKVVCITSSDRLRSGAKVIKDAGPIEWLQLMAGAAYVFTNSFHGLAFSINFEKQFFVELLPPPAKTNTRMIELLQIVELSDRVSEHAIDLEDICFEKVKNRIQDRYEISKCYLESIYT